MEYEAFILEEMLLEKSLESRREKNISKYEPEEGKRTLHKCRENLLLRKMFRADMQNRKEKTLE